MLEIALQPRKVAAIGIIAAMLLVLGYFATQTYRVRVAPGKLQAAMASADWPKEEGKAAVARERIVNPRGLVHMFDMDGEGNVPAIWSVSQLLIVAVLLFVIAKHARTTADASWWLWTILGVGFLFLALDEGGSIHSSFYLSARGEAERRSRGIFYFSWIIPAMIAVAVVGLAYVKFLWRLPAMTRTLFLLAGAWYVGSAVGGEMMQGWWVASGYSKNRLSFAAMTIIEEAGEMLAILLFICALLDYMRRREIAVSVKVADAPIAKPASVRQAAPSLGEMDEDEAEALLPR